MGVILRQSIKGTLVNYVGTFIGFITTLFIITRYLQPEEIGLTRVLLEVAMLFSALAQFGTGSTIIRYFPYFKDGKNNHGLFFYMLCTASIGIVLFIALYWGLDDTINRIFGAKSALFVKYKWWVIPLTIALSLSYFLDNYANALMRITIPRLIREVIVRLMLVVVYLVYAFGSWGVDGLVYGIVFSYVFCTFLSALYARYLGGVRLQRDKYFWTPELKRSMINYTLFCVIGSVGGTLVNKMDIIMVGSQMGLSSAGIFTIAVYMAMVIEIPARSISAISAPITAEAVKNKDLPLLCRMNQMVSLHQYIVGGIVFLYIWININNIFKYIPNGEIYAAGKWVVFFVGCSKMIEMIFGYGNRIISYTKYYYWSFIFTLAITGVTVVTNLWLIPIYGITGAALATFITCMVVYTLNQILVIGKIKASPFSVGIFKFTLLLGGLFFVNQLLPELTNFYADSIYRSCIITLLLFPTLYLFKVSTELNGKVDAFLRKKD